MPVKAAIRPKKGKLGLHPTSTPTRTLRMTRDLREFKRAQGKAKSRLTDEWFNRDDLVRLVVQKKKKGMAATVWVSPKHPLFEDILRHERAHYREILFLLRRGIKRRSNTALAYLSEPVLVWFVRDRPSTGAERTSSFSKMRNDIMSKPIHEQMLDMVVSHEHSFPYKCLDHFEPSEAAALMVQLFRDKKMKPVLERLSNVEVAKYEKKYYEYLPFYPSAKERQLRLDMMSIVDWFEEAERYKIARKIRMKK